jgi:hypothetical protein
LRRSENAFDGDIGHIQIKAAGLDFRKVKYVVNKLKQMPAAVADYPDLLFLISVESFLGEHFAKADYRVHWGANLMAHIREEFTLCLVCFDRLLSYHVGVADGKLKLAINLFGLKLRVLKFSGPLLELLLKLVELGIGFFLP